MENRFLNLIILCVCVCVYEIIFVSLAICLGNMHPSMSGSQTQRL